MRSHGFPGTSIPSLDPLAVSEQREVDSRPETPVAISLEPIDLTLVASDQDGKRLSREMRRQSAGGQAGILEFRPLGEGLDAFWSRGAVFFMRQPGKIVQVLADTRLSVNDMVVDGRYVWVAASKDWGLSVLDRNGKELVRIAKEQGLPPCDHYGMVVYPLGPGSVLAAGSFGNENRMDSYCRLRWRQSQNRSDPRSDQSLGL